MPSSAGKKNVGIEPVLRGHLHRDQQRGAQRRELDGGAASGNEEEGDGASDCVYRGQVLKRVQRGRLARDAERRAAGGLLAERAVIELAVAAVGQQRDRDVGSDEQEGELFFSDPARTEIYTLSLHDALPI